MERKRSKISLRTMAKFLCLIMFLSAAKKPDQGMRIEQLDNRELLADQKREESIELLKKLIRQHPKDSEKAGLLLRLAELYWEKSRYLYFREMDHYDNALKAYKNAPQDQKPKKPILRHRKSKRYRKRAIKIYNKILEDYPTFPEKDFVMYHLALNLNEIGFKSSAIHYYNEIIEKYPQSQFIPHVYLALGEHYFNNNKISRAMAYYQKVLTLDDAKLYGFSLYKIAWCYFNQSRYKESIDTFQKVINFSERQKFLNTANRVDLKDQAINDSIIVFSEWGNIEVAEAFLVKQGGAEFFARNLIKLGDNFLKHGDKDKAVETYQRFLENYPNHKDSPQLHTKLIDIYVTKLPPHKLFNELKKYISAYKKGSPWENINSGNPEAIAAARSAMEQLLSKLGTAFHEKAQKMGNPALLKLAVFIYTNYLRLFEDSPKAYNIHFYLAEIHFEQKNFKEAVAHYRKVINNQESTEYLLDAAYATVLSYQQLAYGNSNAIPPLPIPITKERTIPDSEQTFLDACLYYISLDAPTNKQNKVRFLAGNVYQKYAHFDKAEALYKAIIEAAPTTDIAILSANALLDSYTLRKDWVNLGITAKKLYTTPLVNNLKFKSDLQIVIESAAFKQILSEKDDHTHSDTADRFVAFEKMYPMSQFADEAIYNVVIQYDQAHDYSKSLEVIRHFRKKFQRSSHLKAILLLEAEIYRKTYQYYNAAKLYEYIAVNNPKIPEAKQFLFNAVLIRSSLGNYRDTLKDIDLYYQLYGQDDNLEELLFIQADTLKLSRSSKKAIAHYQHISKQFPQTHLAVKAMIESGLFHYTLKNYGQVKRTLIAAINEYKHLNGLHRKKIPLSLLASAYFHLAMLEYIAFNEIMLQLPVKTFKERLAQKLKLLKRSKNAFIEVIGLGDPEWGIASLYMIGRTYQKLSQALFSAPIPQGLSKEEIKQYRMSLENQAYPIEEKAIEAYEKCYAKSKDLKHFNRWTERALKHLRYYKPSSFQKTITIDHLPIINPDQFVHNAFSPPPPLTGDSDAEKQLRDVMNKLDTDNAETIHATCATVKEILKSAVLNLTAPHYQAYCHLKLKEYTEAEMLYHDLLKLNNSDPIAQFNMALLKWSDSEAPLDEKQMFAIYKSLHNAKVPMTESQQLNWVLLLAWNNEMKAARTTLEGFLQKAPKNNRYIEQLIYLYYYKQSYQMISLIIDSLPVEQVTPNMRYIQALAHLKTDEIGNGMALMEQVTKTTPDHRLALKNLGLLYLYFDDYEPAIEMLSKITPLDSDIAFYIAELYKVTKAYNSAKDLYLNILKSDPSDALTHYRLGILYFEHFERLQDAESHLKKALKLRTLPPKDQEIAYNYIQKIKAKLNNASENQIGEKKN